MALHSLARSLLKRSSVKQVVLLGRLCSTAAPKTTGPTEVLNSSTRIIPTSFSDGLFRFKIGQDTYVLHYWTPVTQIPEVLQSSATVADNQPQPESEVLTEVTEGIEATVPVTPTVKVVDIANQVMDLNAQPIPIGHVMRESSSVIIEGLGQEPLSLQLQGLVDPVRKWESSQGTVMSPEEQALARERQALLASYQPLSQQFTQLLTQAESQADTRFKWGGLFFLSAQLGFVARLTWYEYSWDIMEPITWCITYSLMISTFAYYVMTSQEFLLPLAEKREVQERFWKIANKNNFNVREFRRLRKQLLALDQKRLTIGSQNTAFDRVMRAMQ